LAGTSESTNCLILLLLGYSTFDEDIVTTFMLQIQSRGTTQVSKYQRLWVRRLCKLSHNCGTLCRLQGTVVAVHAITSSKLEIELHQWLGPMIMEPNDDFLAKNDCNERQ
jgi:hypothetical protein